MVNSMRLLFNELIAALLLAVIICYFLFVGHDMKFHALVELSGYFMFMLGQGKAPPLIKSAALSLQ